MLTAEIIPSHTVAQWLLVHIHRFLDLFGLEKDKMTEEIIYVAIIVVTAILLGWLLGYAIRLLLRKIIDVRSPSLAADLKEKHVLARCCRIVPPLVILALLPFAFTGKSIINTIIIRTLLVYTTVIVCMAICSVLSFAWLRFDKERNTKNLPIRGILEPPGIFFSNIKIFNPLFFAYIPADIPEIPIPIIIKSYCILFLLKIVFHYLLLLYINLQIFLYD